MLTDRRILILLLALGAIAAETKSKRTDGYGDPLPEGAIARMGTVRLRQYQVTQVAFSPDGKLLASSGWDGMVRVWDAATNKEIHVLAAQQDYRGCFAFAPDGKVLVAGGADRTLRFWDLTTGKQIRSFQTPEDVHKISYSSDGKILATIGGKKVRLWEAATGKEIRNMTAPQDGYRSLALSPNGKILAVGGSDRTDHVVFLWDVATGREIRTFRGHPGKEKRSVTISPIYINSVAFSPDGKSLAVAGDDAVRLWDIATGKQFHVFTTEIQNWCVAFTPDGKAVASVGNKDRIHLWDTAAGKEIRHYELPYGEVRSLAFSPDGKILAAGDLDRIRLWEAGTGQPISAQRGHSSPVFSIAYSPDGKLLASGSDDKTVRLWDASTGKAVRIFRGHRNQLSSVAFSPDGKTLASGSRDETARLWEVASGKPIRTLHCQTWVTAVAFSPNGKTLVTGGLSGGSPPSLRLWDPFTGKEKSRRLENSDSIHSDAIALNGKYLASGDGTKIHLWDVTTGKAIRVLSGHKSDIRSVAFSPDGRLIASGSWAGQDDTIRLWDADSGQQLHILRPPHNSAWSVAFSPDGALLASGGWGQRVHLWDVLTGKEVYAFRGHCGAVCSVLFSPDGRVLASSSRDTSCLVWDMAVPFRPKLPPSSRLSDRQRERLWSALGGTDALAAWRSVYELAADLDQTVPFLDRHLQTPLADPQQVRHWIADLDSDTFAVRETAQRELEQRGEIVSPALQHALQKKPTLEARKRIERLLADATTRVPSGEYLARLRVLTVLERIGTPAARRVLEKVAQGESSDRRTRTAKAALQRLARRRGKRP